MLYQLSYTRVSHRARPTAFPPYRMSPYRMSRPAMSGGGRIRTYVGR